MTAPTPGDMSQCDPKCRCPSGDYAGTAYSCDKPCAGQGDDCSFDCENGCQCNKTCASSWNIIYTSVSSADFSPCGASCTWTPTFGNLINFSATGPGTFSSQNYSYVNEGCGGPPYGGQTAKSVFGVDRVWNGGGGWTNGDVFQIGSATDWLALKITICDGAEAGVVYGRLIAAGVGANECSLAGQVLVVTEAAPNVA